MTVTLTMFSGVDSNSREAIWTTDGTATGTIEIAALYGTSNKPYGEFTQLGSKVIFAGEGSNFTNTLWVTDGTKAGTHQIAVTGASGSQGLNPLDMTRLGSTKAMFSGIGTDGGYGLWVTNGTIGGTREIAGTEALNAQNLIAYGGKVLFASYAKKGLWTSDGTAADTREVAGTASIVPTEMTLVAGKILFKDGLSGLLYTTDGTAAGTRKLGAYLGDGTDLTAYGSRVMLQATDSNGHSDLFITNGTAAGTRQVPNTTGIFDGLAAAAKDGKQVSPDLTLYKGKMYFEAASAGGGYGLWVSDGTAAGTHEITGIKGALASGIFSSPSNPDFNGPDFAVQGGLLVFDGAAPGGQAAQFGQTSLWVTDGTAAGTHPLKVKGAGSSTTLGLDASNMTGVQLPGPATAAHSTFTSALFEAAFAPSQAAESARPAEAAAPTGFGWGVAPHEMAEIFHRG